MENHSSAGGKSCFFHINPSNFSSCCNRHFGDIRLKIYKLPIFNPGWGGGGTPIHFLYRYVPPNRVVILKLLIQNGVSISQAFSRTGYNISNARKHQFCTQPFEIIQGQIAFKSRVQCVNTQIAILLLHPRTEYKKLAHFQNGVSVLG